MTKRLGSFLGVVSLVVGLTVLVSCTVQPVPLIYVKLSPSAPQTLEGGQTLNVTGSVPNDLTNAGVSWSLNPATGEGTLVNPTLTTVTYQAPATVTSATKVALIASANVQPAKMGQLTINLVPGPSFTNPNLTGGFVGTAYSATISVTGGIAPYTWTVASGSLPPGLSLTNANTPTVTIGGTPTTVGTFPFTIQVKDSAGATFTSGQLSIQIQAANTLRITSTSPLPNGTALSAYSFTFAASGGTAPYTWAVETGSALPGNLTLSAAGLLSGTPQASGTSSFGITVTDSATPTNMFSMTFSLTINPQGTGNLTGGYAFVFHGSNKITIGGIQVPQTIVEAGTFSVAADGTTVSGTLDYNTTGGQNYIGQSFTGTASFGTDNRGTVTFNGLTQGTQTFAFAMDATVDHGRMVELDTSGITGSGEIFKQTFTPCTASAFSGNYVFGMSGGSGQVGNIIFPATAAGRFNTDGISSIQLGEMDLNTPSSSVPPGFYVTGTYKAISAGGACQLSFGSGPLTTVNVYPISAMSGVITQAVAVQTDPVAATNYTAIFAGKIDQQIGTPFSQTTSLTATSVGVLVGQISLDGEITYVPDVYVMQLGISGNNFTIDYTEDQNGVVGTFNQKTTPPGYSGSYSIDQYGRVTFVGIGAQMYLINVNQGVFLTTTTSNPNPLIGYLDPQATGVTFSALMIKGTFETGTVGAAFYQVPNFSGEYTLDGTSVVSGTQDTSSTAGNSSGQAVSGTYNGINGTTGFGDFTFTSPTSVTGVFCIVSTTKVVGITTPVSNTGANPQAFIMGH
jgi:Putative Ig domain